VGRSTKQQSLETAAAILTHARERFAASSFAAVSLEEIARAAGVTRGAVYHHFGSSEGLFARVHEQAQADLAAAIAHETAEVDDPERSLRSGSRVFLRTVVGPNLRQIVLVDGPAVLGWARWRDADAQNSGAHLTEVLEELHDAGQLRSRDPEATSALLSGAMNELALWVAHHPAPADALERALAAIELAIDGEVVPPPARTAPTN